MSDADPACAALIRIRDNAFHVLELAPSCNRLDVERQGQKLLAMLELGLASAASYPTPVGPAARDADKVRLAMAKLRDPDRRLEEELWARLRASSKQPVSPDAPADATADLDSDPSIEVTPLPRAPRFDAPWPEALQAFGWGRR